MILAAQNIQSLPADVVQAVSNVGTHVVFQQGWDDANHYFKAFGGQIGSEELLSCRVGEGFAKLGEEFAEISTKQPTTLRGIGIVDEIRDQTRELYCVLRSETNDSDKDVGNHNSESLDDLDVI